VLDPMDCLRDGVPPLLLIDLFGEAGPDAAHIYEDEPADDLSWTHPIDESAVEVEGQLPILESTSSARELVPEARGAGSGTRPPTSACAH
jgi:hypothetical protein